MWQSILNFLISILGIVIFIFATSITWNVYHHFWSLAEAVHESNFSYFIKRLGVFVTVGVVSAFLVVGGLMPNKTSNNKNMESTSYPTNSSTNESIIEDTTRTKTITNDQSQDRLIIPEKINSYTRNENNINEISQRKIDSETFIKQPQNLVLPKEFTREEIEQMEKEKQYSGDDPVVRRRLGLPPKSN